LICVADCCSAAAGAAGTCDTVPEVGVEVADAADEDAVCLALSA
jgi:hypothetical protein